MAKSIPPVLVGRLTPLVCSLYELVCSPRAQDNKAHSWWTAKLTTKESIAQSVCQPSPSVSTGAHTGRCTSRRGAIKRKRSWCYKLSPALVLFCAFFTLTCAGQDGHGRLCSLPNLLWFNRNVIHQQLSQRRHPRAGAHRGGWRVGQPWGELRDHRRRVKKSLVRHRRPPYGLGTETTIVIVALFYNVGIFWLADANVNRFFFIGGFAFCFPLSRWNLFRCFPVVT